MKAAVLCGRRKMRIDSIDTPRVKDYDVLIRVKAASICGTDVHFYKGEIGKYAPKILGHDFSGVIEEVGKNVREFSKSDRVIAEIVRYCGNCNFCKAGNYQICMNASYMGFDIDGAFAEYVVAPAKNVFKIPDNVSFEEAAIMEPVALALHVMDFVQPKIGEAMAILGQGPVGLVQTQIAKLCGMKVIAVEQKEERLKLAREFGADYIINPTKENLKDAVLDITNGLGADFCVEAVGLQETVDQTVEITKKGGKIILVGESKGLRGPPIRHEDMTWFALSDGGTNKYPIALDLVSKGKINVKRLITHEVALDKLPQTMESLADGKMVAIKVVVKP